MQELCYIGEGSEITPPHFSQRTIQNEHGVGVVTLLSQGITPWALPTSQAWRPTSKNEYRKSRISFWQVPPRSPDLNPVEQYWSWLRRRLRALDLADLTAKRPVSSKAAYIQRVRNVVRSQISQEKAANIARSSKKKCGQCVKNKGRAIQG